MRLVFDLFPCQTDSRFRGIGRYTYALVEAMARLRGRHDFHALVNGAYQESADALRQDFATALPPGHFASYTHPGRASFAHDSNTYTAVATALIHRAYQALTPDVVVTTPFEGWGEDGITPLPHGNLPTALRVGVLYDFIPWLFPEHYLNPVPGYKEWYMRRLAALDKFDLLLAISEATRRDAIDVLGIAPERVVNISGAVSHKFRPMAAEELARHNMARFGIARPFVLYTGNADYRKNQGGMLQAYARLPAALRKTHQLVLNQVGNKAVFWDKVRALGLAKDEVVVTGHITDDELISLYTQCKVFVFPSLYEGFGLPILEAMACGAPVIAGNNSSIPEVVGRDDLLFDAADPSAIAVALQKVLVDDRLRAELARYSIERAKTFSWDRTATLAWRAIEASAAAKRATPIQHYLPHLPNARIAVVAPPLQDSTVARHCIALLPLLARHFEIDLFVEEGAPVDAPLLQAAFAIYPHTRLAALRDRYATVVYQLDNHASHAYMLPLMEQWVGVVVLHAIDFGAVFTELARRTGMAQVVENEILYSHGIQGLIAYLKQDTRQTLSMSRRILESAHCLIVPDENHATVLEKALHGTWLPPRMTLTVSDMAASVATYAQAIHTAIGSDDKHTIEHLADALESAEQDPNILNAIAGHATANWNLRKQARILVDVTQLARMDLLSGIQRVVKNIAKEICRQPDQAHGIELVRLVDGELRRASHVIASIFDVDVERIPEQEIVIQPGDVLLMIDSSWEQYGDFLPIFESVRRLGGKIITVVYDLIPLRMPQMCLPALVSVFERWFHLAVEQSDMLLCISRSIAEDVAAYLAEQEINVPREPEITYWPLGADIAISGRETGVRTLVNQIVADKQNPLFLMVGTVEPRKGHDFVLDAFESLWRNGADVHLCIAGQEGWRVGEIMQRIRNHPQLNTKLFFVEKFTDAEINLCYAAATALIAASVAEGYGLPIVEAALHKVPVLASDIPVFREVGGEGAKYFSLDNPQCLADAVTAFSQVAAEERSIMASRIKTVTWNNSAKRLLERIL